MVWLIRAIASPSGQGRTRTGAATASGPRRIAPAFYDAILGCLREAGIAEEDSLAENVMREGLHPLDQFRAFSALIEAGLSEEDIAARFFVSVSTVRQRLRLASVSPTLLDVYGDDGMSLEQLMAFSVTDNHARQEQVWEQLKQTYQPSAHQIRRLLTEDAIAVERLRTTMEEGGNNRSTTAAMANLAEAIQGLVAHMRTEQQMIREWADGQGEQNREIKKLLEVMVRENVNR